MNLVREYKIHRLGASVSQERIDLFKHIDSLYGLTPFSLLNSAVHYYDDSKKTIFFHIDSTDFIGISHVFLHKIKPNGYSYSFKANLKDNMDADLYKLLIWVFNDSLRLKCIRVEQFFKEISTDILIAESIALNS